MKLIDRLQSDKTEAMKARLRTDSNLLGVLISDAKKTDKSPEDGAVLKAMRSTKKQLTEALSHAKDADKQREIAYELELIEGYLPQLVGAGELKAFIDTLPADDHMGKKMGSIKKKFGERADMKLAKEILDKG